MNYRRLASVTAVVLLAATLSPARSHADTSSTVTVVGTSDVYDSDLVQNVIKPDFEKAYPQYSLNYVSQGTGAAISYAEAGTASALLVHAASLENQFVSPPSGPSYSYEPYGRAIFYGDFVLLGPSNGTDPAGVLANAPHDIVTAFEDIAAAGAKGDVNFVSRGGTPGTTVEEHQIWSLTSSDPDLCTVSTASGGGESPSTTTGACGSPISYPSWYHATGLTQGPNVTNADVCNYSGGNCYVLTDRGTYQYLAQEGAIHSLAVVTNNNSPAARGGSTLLVNSFHAYAVNPARFAGNSAVQINVPGAEAFLNWLTSPTGQADVDAYDPGGGVPPFLPDAAPAITAKSFPSTVRAGHHLTISGSLTNRVPGTPALTGVKVTLSEHVPGVQAPVMLATATTGLTGAYRLSAVPTETGSYVVTSAPITQIENATLQPVFGDLLQPATLNLHSVKVAGVAVITRLRTSKGKVHIEGTLSPHVTGSAAQVRVYARRVGSSVPIHLVKSARLVNGAKRFSIVVQLRRHDTWRIIVKYVNTGRIVVGATKARSVHVH